jgi:hypothetical protein
VPAQEGRSQGSPLQIDDNGDLVLQTAGSEVRLQKPLIYQEINGVKQPISGGYVLLSPQSSSLITFEVAAYDTSKPLVIDPIMLIYSTYLGGSGTEGNASGVSGDGSIDIAVDAAGHAYVTGTTFSPDFPTTSGAFDTTCGTDGTCNGGFDAFVTKFNPAGTALLYSTYLGGSGNDTGDGIAVDATGKVYVTGVASPTTDFPTTPNAFQGTAPSTSPAFVAVLDPSQVGSVNPNDQLVYSTYLGGDAMGHGIAVGPTGNIYVTGRIDSDIFGLPVTPAREYVASADAFVAVLDPSPPTCTSSALNITITCKESLLYFTFLGGTGIDGGSSTAIAVDALGNAHVTGDTNSINTNNTLFPTTANAFQKDPHPFGRDAFVTVLAPFPPTCNPDLNDPNINCSESFLYSTFLGGSDFDNDTVRDGGIAVDFSGKAYVTGMARSDNFPTTANAFQLPKGGGDDAFVAVLNPFVPLANCTSDVQNGIVINCLESLLYSTYLGGSGIDRGTDIAVDFSSIAVDALPPGSNVPPPPGRPRQRLCNGIYSFAQLPGPGRSDRPEARRG